jgi:hypothetical protein
MPLDIVTKDGRDFLTGDFLPVTKDRGEPSQRFIAFDKVNIGTTGQLNEKLLTSLCNKGWKFLIPNYIVNAPQYIRPYSIIYNSEKAGNTRACLLITARTDPNGLSKIKLPYDNIISDSDVDSLVKRTNIVLQQIEQFGFVTSIPVRLSGRKPPTFKTI